MISYLGSLLFRECNCHLEIERLQDEITKLKDENDDLNEIIRKLKREREIVIKKGIMAWLGNQTIHYKIIYHEEDDFFNVVDTNTEVSLIGGKNIDLIMSWVKNQNKKHLHEAKTHLPTPTKNIFT